MFLVDDRPIDDTTRDEGARQRSVRQDRGWQKISDTVREWLDSLRPQIEDIDSAYRLGKVKCPKERSHDEERS